MFQFRDRIIAKRIVEQIASFNRTFQFMHVCGTHQDTLVRFGLDALLVRSGVRVVQGPGCPVCVTTPKEIEEAKLLARHGVVVATFGDMTKVPSMGESLQDLRGEGCDIRVVYSIDDAVRISHDLEGELVFFAAGFETTAPSTAAAVLRGLPENMTILSCHRTVPNALVAILSSGETSLDGLIEPGHVSTIIGMRPYEPISERFQIPQVIAGFEPLDLLMSILMLCEMVRSGEHRVKNEYSRVVRPDGNRKAQEALREVFRSTDVAWRGFSVIPESGLELRREFDSYNARVVYGDLLKDVKEAYDEPSGCRCGDVLRGVADPVDCPLFGSKCRPMEPVGPCMVSKEGSCNILYRYGIRRV